MKTINEVAKLGGSARTPRKGNSSRANLATARERKLLYRLHPELRLNVNQPVINESNGDNKGVKGNGNN